MEKVSIMNLKKRERETEFYQVFIALMDCSQTGEKVVYFWRAQKILINGLQGEIHFIRAELGCIAEMDLNALSRSFFICILI